MTRLALTLAALLIASPAAWAKKDPRPVLDGVAAANSVVLCKTTLAELQDRLGPPTRDGLLHSARIVSWVTEWDPLAKYLAVLVDAHGVVTDLYWNVPTEIPWAPASQCTGR